MKAPIYKLTVHPTACRSKQDAINKTPIVSSTILDYPEKLNIKQLAERVLAGDTFMPAEMNYTKEEKQKRKQDASCKFNAAVRHWSSQQLFAIDIDNEHYCREKKQKIKAAGDKYLDLNAIIRIASQRDLSPALIYETFSSTDQHKKFRVVFALNEVVTDQDVRQRIMQALVETYFIDNHLLIDVSCINPSRMFFGGTRIVYVDEFATNRLEKLLSIPITYARVTGRGPKASNTNAQLRSLIKSDTHNFIKMVMNEEWETVQKTLHDVLAHHANLTASRDQEQFTKVQTLSLEYINTIEIMFGLYTNPGSPTAVRDEATFVQIMRQFPLHALFGVECLEPLRCLLPDHDDHSPSAQFEQTASGTYVYHCYGCQYKGRDTMLDLIELFRLLTNESYGNTIRRLLSLFNVTIETDWQKTARYELWQYQNMYFDENMMKDMAPDLYAYLKRSNMLVFLGVLMSEVSRNLLDKDITGRDEILHSVPIRSLSRKMTSLSLPGSGVTQVSKKMHLASILGLIEYIPDTEDSYLIQSSKANLLSKKILQGLMHKYRSNVFRIPHFKLQVILEANERVKQLKKSGFKNKHADKREAYVWSSSKEEVDKHFLQDQDLNTRSEYTEKAFSAFVKGAKDLLDKEGYFTSKTLLGSYTVRQIKQKEKLLDIVMPELIKELEIEKVRYSKYYAEKLNISQSKRKNFYPGRTILHVLKS